jgi:hypothetical protein
MSWDEAAEHFRKFGKPNGVRYCEMMKRRGCPEPDSVGTGTPGYESVQWHNPPRLVRISASSE